MSDDSKGKAKGFLLGGGAIAVALAKSKGLLLMFGKGLTLLKFGWLLKSFLSMFLFFGVYWVRFGWQFALGFLVLLMFHEGGHYAYMKMKGLDPKLPIFLPFIGAITEMNKLPPDRATRAWSAFAGPFVGALSSGLVYSAGIIFDQDLLLALGYFGFVLNLIQLVPMKPLDGGFMAEAVWKWLLVPGVGIAFVLGLMFKSALLLLVSVIGIFAAYKSLTTHDEEMVNEDGTVTRVQETSLSDKITIGACYVGLLLALGVCTWHSGLTLHQ